MRLKGVIAVLFLLGADLLCKVIYRDISMTTGGFGFNFTLNTGSAFGMFSGVVFYLYFIIFLSILILGFVWRFQKLFPWQFLVLINAGVIGNLVDRILLGAVRDFIMTPWFTFNLADLYLTSCCIVILYEIAVGKV